VEAAAHALGRQIRIHAARNEAEIAAAFAQLPQLRAQALLVMGDSFFTSRSEQVGAWTLRYALPAMFPNRDFITAGGLMAYDTDPMDAYPLIALYTRPLLTASK